MNKQALIEFVVKETNLDKKDVSTLVEAVFDGILLLLMKEQKMVISNFGTFKLKESPAFKGRNPKTGERMIVPAKNKISLKISSSVKQLINSED